MKLLAVVLGLFMATLATQGCTDYKKCPEGQVKCEDTQCRDCCANADCASGKLCCEDFTCQDCCRDEDCLPGETCSILGMCVAEGTCGADGDCHSGEHCCNDGNCHDCCIDDNCLSEVPNCPEDYIICNDDYECECVCYDEYDDCSRSPEACCYGLACDLFTNTCMTECTSDADCQSRTEIPYHEDLKCKDGICDFDHCTQDADCPAGRVCFGGTCVTIPYCSDLQECVVLPDYAVTRHNTTARFAATAYLRSGAVAPGFIFAWSSSDGSVAAVDNTGLVTGGADSGSATITAVVGGCGAISCTASVINYGAVANTRVLVVDELTSKPIPGATVVVGAEAPVLTDANGVAQFGVDINAGNPADITVSKLDYHYVTLKNVTRNDVNVQLGAIHHLDFSAQPPTDVAGGIRGDLDFRVIRCEPPNRTCDVSFGLAGLSVPGNLITLTFDIFLGGYIMTEIELGGSTEEIPLPSGMVLCLNQTCFKRYYASLGVPGRRLAWALGGKVDLADLIDKLGPIISGGSDIDMGALIAGLLPLFSTFYTALVPNVMVENIPMVPDVNDIDGDPDTDMVPDYDSFPDLDMVLKVKMEETMTFNTPTLQVGVYDGVVVIAGVVVRGAGFVPLGIAAGTDPTDSMDTPDGIIDDPIVVNIADVAGRIPEGQVQRAIIALAMGLDALAEVGTPYYAGQILFVDDFSGTHSLNTFLDPAEATYDPQTRHLTVIQTPAGVDYHQAIFKDDRNTSWNVLTDNLSSFDLPLAPPQGDRSSQAGIFCIDLADGMTYQDLVEFNEANMGDLAELVKAFSFTKVQ